MFAAAGFSAGSRHILFLGWSTNHFNNLLSFDNNNLPLIIPTAYDHFNNLPLIISTHRLIISLETNETTTCAAEQSLIVYIYICIYIYIYTHMVHICMYIYVCIYIYIYTHTRLVFVET